MSHKLSKQFVYLNFNQTIFHEYDADFYENVSPGRETNHFGHKNIYHIILVMKHIRIGFVNNVIIISETFLFFQGSQQMHQQQQQQQSAGSFMQKSTSSSTSSSSATTQVKSILKQPQQQQQIRQHGEEIGQEKLKTQIQSAITDIEDNIDRRDFADKENMSPTQQQQQQQQMMFQQQQQQVDI